MNIDTLDLEILYILFQSQKEDIKHTSTCIANRIFYPKNMSEMRKKESKIRYRLSRLVDAGLILSENSGIKSYYSLKGNNVIFGDGQIEVKIKKKKMSLPLGKIFLLNHEGKYLILGFDQERLI